MCPIYLEKTWYIRYFFFGVIFSEFSFSEFFFRSNFFGIFTFGIFLSGFFFGILPLRDFFFRGSARLPFRPRCVFACVMLSNRLCYPLSIICHVPYIIGFCFQQFSSLVFAYCSLSISFIYLMLLISDKVFTKEHNCLQNSLISSFLRNVTCCRCLIRFLVFYALHGINLQL